MDHNKSINGDVCVMAISGKFTFSDHVEFKSLLKVFDDSSVNQVDLDLKGLEFVDSAALGLLLLAKDKADTSSKKIRLLSPGDNQVKKMFEISRFYDLFEIVD